MKRLISLAISLTILAIIYWRIDILKAVPIFANASAFWMTVSLAMVIPLTMLTAWRLCILMPGPGRLPFWESNRLILLASVLNLVLPSKMGDVAKSAFMAERGHLRGGLALSLVVFEKACDMLSLLVWCVFGLMLYPHKDALFWAMTAAVAAGLVGFALLVGSRRFAGFFFGLAVRFAPGKVGSKIGKLQGAWEEMHGAFWQDKGRLVRVGAMSLVIWFFHLVQIWMFTLALREGVPFLASLALAPLALLAGLIPLTFAGVGTRDAALIFFFSPYLSAPAGAALGILCTLRYVLPALVGLPFIGPAIRALGGWAAVRTLRTAPSSGAVGS